MAKKINCKDGLTNQEEIQARRLKNKLLSNDVDGARARIEFNYYIYERFKEYSRNRDEFSDFNSFMKSKYPIVYSASKRINLDLIEIVWIMHENIT